MAAKKTLYEVLQVSRSANERVIAAAYQARLAALGSSAAPEVVAEKAVLRDAYAILSDPVRRTLYDQKLREDAMRAMASGSDLPPRVPASATLAPALASSSSSPLAWMIGIAILAAVGIGGAATYWNHKHAQEEARIEEARRVEQKRLAEEAAQRERENQDWAKTQYEQRQKDMEMRRWEAQRDRDRATSERYARQATYDEQRRIAAERRAEYERQHLEQQNLYRQQLELQRQQRYLQELERNRAMRF